MNLLGTRLFYLPVQTRVPLKFGSETLTEVTCARVRVEVGNAAGQRAVGWGETPLSIQWIWPGLLPYSLRLARVREFCERLTGELVDFDASGHPLLFSHAFQESALPALLKELNSRWADAEPMPWLAALVCFSAFDLALHDAFGNLLGRPVFETYSRDFLKRDLSELLEGDPLFKNRFPSDFLQPRRDRLPAWHLVGGLDWLDASEVDGPLLEDGYPVLLEDWIRRDGLTCLKIKLRGTDAAWDYARLVKVGTIALANGVEALSTDFNCTVHDPRYVGEILERLSREHPAIDALILYVEQPFPYELEEHRIDVHELAAVKPLFLDESAHDWRMVRLGHELGWNGVALKTCKTLTGALLSASWAQAHGMALMVQDLTNPMLAQIPHVQLAAHLPTLKGVETNAMQFYPEASRLEALVHPGLYERRHGHVDLSSVRGPGLGYRLAEMTRRLPDAAAGFER